MWFVSRIDDIEDNSNLRRGIPGRLYSYRSGNFVSICCLINKFPGGLVLFSANTACRFNLWENAQYINTLIKNLYQCFYDADFQLWHFAYDFHCRWIFSYCTDFPKCIFSSPGHHVLLVSYCDHMMSVVCNQQFPLTILTSLQSCLRKDVLCMKLFEICSKSFVPCRSLFAMAIKRQNLIIFVEPYGQELWFLVCSIHCLLNLHKIVQIIFMPSKIAPPKGFKKYTLYKEI